MRLAEGCDRQRPELEKTQSVFEPELEHRQVRVAMLRQERSSSTVRCEPRGKAVPGHTPDDNLPKSAKSSRYPPMYC
jgi:hypothetical protein